MRRFQIALLAALLFSPVRLAHSQKPVDIGALRLAFYDYDRAMPLNAEVAEMPEKSPSEAAIRTRFLVHYDSAHDQRVPAIFTVPRKFAPPFPAVVLLAGSGGNKDTDYIRMSADLMSQLGFATISIDAQYHGERARKGYTGDFHLINTPTNRDAWVQTVIDLRRAVDYLHSRPDIDRSRTGYLGFSQGGMAGGTFLGVEPRISCGILAVAGGGFAEWSKRVGMWKPEFDEEVRVNAAIVDPIYFIGRFAPRPLLMLSARKDELIPRFATEALYNAAGQPKQIVWMEGGHTSAANLIVAIPAIRSFFVKHLGERKPS